nr:hypothetical protein BaRGS_004738 [Batillaria attramentaria]
MEYSSNKPLALQVYKTAAEFKAHRLNRSEQSRLNTARFSISKEARSLEKDFRLTKAKLESQFRRRSRLQSVAFEDLRGSPCARPDLLNASRKQDELEKRNKRKKADMIEEVMNKLGLARTNCDGVKDKA